MSRGKDYARFNTAAQSLLASDVGPVEDEGCAVDPCPDEAAYRVPWPSVGGDVAYCEYHLVRYREQHPDLFDRVQDVVDDDLTEFATRGDRFLVLEEVPETLFDDEFRLLALLVDGRALYVRTAPDGKTVQFRAVDRTLGNPTVRELQEENVPEFLDWVERKIGVHGWADGGEQR